MSNMSIGKYSNKLIAISTIVILLLITFVYISKNMQNGKVTANRFNCLSDDCLAVDDLEYPAEELPDSVKSALDKAIKDEYTALNTYQAVVTKMGSVRPFSMIIGAEEQHIATLKAIYDKYGLVVPSNKVTNIKLPETLSEVCKIGVDAEIANAKLYREDLLPTVTKYPDISSVFTNLMNASENKHLPAFRKCS